MTLPATTGEAWAAQELARLRDARHHPRAWLAFLAASLRRARATRRARPALARQSARWAAAGVFGSAAAREALAAAGARAPSRSGAAGWAAATALMLDWHLGMVEGIAGEPRERLSPADALTAARLGLAPFVAAAPPGRGAYLALLATGALSDALDGRLARAHGATRLGRDLDPLADLAFRAAAAAGARRAGWLPGPALAALAARHAVLVAGAAAHWFGRAGRPPADALRVARWDAPPLVAGLGLCAAGRSRAATALVTASAAIGVTGALLQAAARG